MALQTRARRCSFQPWSNYQANIVPTLTDIVPAGGGGGGGDSNIKKVGMLVEKLKLTPKGDQSGRGSRVF